MSTCTAKAVTKYRTMDGQEFDSLGEAFQHEEVMSRDFINSSQELKELYQFTSGYGTENQLATLKVIIKNFLERGQT